MESKIYLGRLILPESKIYLGRQNGVQDLSGTSKWSPRFILDVKMESKIYLGRLEVRSPRFILDAYLFTIGFFEIIFMNIYS
jgi:hypothetical protein